MDVSVIIVNYNTCSLLKNCLESVFKHTQGIDFQVIVSDNGSIDDSVPMVKNCFPQVFVIENNANLGFGAANNRALDKAVGKYILYLNSDTLLLNNAVKIFFDFFELHGDERCVGALGCNLIDSDGKLIYCGGKLPLLKTAVKDMFFTALGIWKKFFKKKVFGIPYDKITPKYFSQNPYYGELENITAACMFLKNNDDARFDEKIFLYNEDTDLCMRMKKSGLQCHIIEGPKVVHLEGKSCERYSDKVSYFRSFSVMNFNLYRVYYFRKHSGSRFGVFLLKCMLSLLWINPEIFPDAREYVGKLWKI